LTNPVSQYVELTIPADVSGEAHSEIVVHVSKPNINVYIDPQAEVI